MPHYSENAKTREKKKDIESQKRKKCQFTSKGKYVRITSDFSAETLKARQVWNDI
jgi:hypothetical protein